VQVDLRAFDVVLVEVPPDAVAGKGPPAAAGQAGSRPHPGRRRDAEP
jgi:hypothetical protein